MDIKEFASLGGKARWKGVSRQKRKEAMKKIANMPRKKARKLSTSSMLNSKQARE